MSEEESILDALEKRLERLERLVLGSKPNVPQPRLTGDCIISRIKAIQAQLHAIETQLPELSTLYKIANTIDTHSRTLLSPQSKYELVAAKEDDIRNTSTLAQSFAEHTQFINSPHLRQLGDTDKQLATRQERHAVLLEEATQLNNRFISLVEEHQQITSMLSKKFAYWDYALREAEKMLSTNS